MADEKKETEKAAAEHTAMGRDESKTDLFTPRPVDKKELNSEQTPRKK
jgi:hypothetical protein